MGPVSCTETSVANEKSTLSNIPEECNLLYTAEKKPEIKLRMGTSCRMRGAGHKKHAWRRFEINTKFQVGIPEEMRPLPIPKVRQ
jgi:hypothetical protein